MTTTLVVFLALGAAAGGFINGLSGTDTALFALGFFLMVLPPLTAVAIVSLFSIMAGFQGLWVVRADIKANKSRLLHFLLPGLLGVPVGVMLLEYIDADTLRLCIGGLLVLYTRNFCFSSPQRLAVSAVAHRAFFTDGCRHPATRCVLVVDAITSLYFSRAPDFQFTTSQCKQCLHKF